MKKRSAMKATPDKWEQWLYDQPWYVWLPGVIGVVTALLMVDHDRVRDLQLQLLESVVSPMALAWHPALPEFQFGDLVLVVILVGIVGSVWLGCRHVLSTGKVPFGPDFELVAGDEG
jgi:hypothetical protein